jgi:hypothetical protein
LQKIRYKKRKRKEESNADIEREAKQFFLNTDLTHSYLFSSQGMVSFTPEYIPHLKESYPERSYLGTPKYSCKYCNAIFWESEKNTGHSPKNKEVEYSNCCKYGEIKIPPYRAGR